MDILVIVGSETDKQYANILLEVLRDVGAKYRVSYASCHRHSGGKERRFENLIADARERIILMLGGLTLAAPGMIQSHLNNAWDFDKIVIGVPTDMSALDAIQALPKGTAVLTCGFNATSVKHSVINAALAAAKLALMLGGNLGIDSGLHQWYENAASNNQFNPNVELKDGLIP